MLSAVRSLIQTICQIPFNATTCGEIATNLATPILRRALDFLLNSETMCKKTGFCRYPIFIPDDEKEFIYRVLKDKPPVRRPVVDPNGEKFTFAAFGDVHVDRYYASGTEADCGFSICCRGWQTSKEEEIERPAGKWGTVGMCDIPMVDEFA